MGLIRERGWRHDTNNRKTTLCSQPTMFSYPVSCWQTWLSGEPFLGRRLMVYGLPSNVNIIITVPKRRGVCIHEKSTSNKTIRIRRSLAYRWCTAVAKTWTVWCERGINKRLCQISNNDHISSTDVRDILNYGVLRDDHTSTVMQFQVFLKVRKANSCRQSATNERFRLATIRYSCLAWVCFCRTKPWC